MMIQKKRSDSLFLAFIGRKHVQQQKHQTLNGLMYLFVCLFVDVHSLMIINYGIIFYSSLKYSNWILRNTFTSFILFFSLSPSIFNADALWIVFVYICVENYVFDSAISCFMPSRPFFSSMKEMRSRCCG